MFTPDEFALITVIASVVTAVGSAVGNDWLLKLIKALFKKKGWVGNALRRRGFKKQSATVGKEKKPNCAVNTILGTQSIVRLSTAYALTR